MVLADLAGVGPAAVVPLAPHALVARRVVRLLGYVVVSMDSQQVASPPTPLARRVLAVRQSPPITPVAITELLAATLLLAPYSLPTAVRVAVEETIVAMRLLLLAPARFRLVVLLSLVVSTAARRLRRLSQAPRPTVTRSTTTTKAAAA